MKKSDAGVVRMARYSGVVLLSVPVLAFAAYSLRFGIRGLGIDLSQETHIYAPDAPSINFAIFSHMILGAVIMVLAPTQLIGSLRAQYPRVHRVTGRVIVVSCITVALGGLLYIGFRGTVAGPLMDLGFAIYGGLMLFSAVQVMRFARAGDLECHRAWALRLLLLAMGSLIYRLHYAIWYILTDGLWSRESLDGPFDQVQYFAFYLPYLVILEMWIRQRTARAAPSA